VNVTTTEAKPPLAVGTPVQVIRATYSVVPVRTRAKVSRVRVDHGGQGKHLHEMVGYPEYLFWAWELTWEGKGQ
jgi:hypothetical protein